MTSTKEPVASAITHREFKLLLKPEKFPKRSALLDFNRLLEQSAKKLGVRYEPFDSLDSQLRIVQFYDTPRQSLRKRDLIFRVRQLREGGWPDDTWEITFKCRAPEFEKASGFDSNSAFSQQKMKFKEELLHGGMPGTMKTIYSNNCIVEGPELKVEVPLAKLGEAFPHLKTLDIDLNQELKIVDGAKIFEIQANLGNLFFGHHTTATATLAVWARPVPDRFEPLVAEFGWSYHPVNDEKGKEADAVADKFFKALQLPLADWITSGTTKTAIIYGDQGA